MTARAKLQTDVMNSLTISIGMMAHNEANGIAQTLRSLMAQDVMRSPSIAVELVILANGCVDGTVVIADQTLASLTQGDRFGALRWSVAEIEQPGKSNAWNLFVHQLSNPAADYLLLMDSDIELLGDRTLADMLDAFAAHPQAQIVVDRPIKDVMLEPSKTLREKLSALLSGLSGERLKRSATGDPAWLCGQLYAAKAAVLRQLYLPVSALAEDGFLYQMVVTDSLRSVENPHRVIVAETAAHSFEAYTRLRRLLKHERWLIASSAAHTILLAHLRRRGWCGVALNDYIHRRNQAQPNWLAELVAIEATRRWWLIPRMVATRRFASLAHKPWHKAVLLLPIAIAAFLVDQGLSLLANRDLRRGQALRYWGKPVAAGQVAQSLSENAEQEPKRAEQPLSKV